MRFGNLKEGVGGGKRGKNGVDTFRDDEDLGSGIGSKLEELIFDKLRRNNDGVRVVEVGKTEETKHKPLFEIEMVRVREKTKIMNGVDKNK